jgi:hypothetical protein
LLGWVGRQAARVRFSISIDKYSSKRSTLSLQCERSGEYKTQKTRKKLNLEGTGTRKCDCWFRLCCFFDKDTNDWWLEMLNGIYNNELMLKLAVHLLAGRIKEEEKKTVIDMTKSMPVPRNILTNLKQKKTKKYYQTSVQCAN